MTNREWLLEQIQNMSDEELARLINGFPAGVCDLGCEGEKASNCMICKENWLKAEHKEPIKPSDTERVILENIGECYKWIARDDDGELVVFPRQPSKIVEGEGGFWCRTLGEASNLGCFNHLFQFITWEDENPYNIEELLGK